jgi:hypothetical protein
MKIHIITKLARQVEGEHVFVNALAAFTDRVKAEEFLKNLSYQKAEVIAGTECLIEMGILYDLEVTE